MNKQTTLTSATICWRIRPCLSNKQGDMKSSGVEWGKTPSRGQTPTP